MRRDHRILREFRTLRADIAARALAVDSNVLGSIQRDIEVLVAHALDDSVCPYRHTVRQPVFSLAGLDVAAEHLAQKSLEALTGNAVAAFEDRVLKDVGRHEGAGIPKAKARDRDAAARDTIIILKVYLILIAAQKACAALTVAGKRDDKTA